MDDQQIYALSSSVISSIVADLSGGIYRELGGSLSFGWSTHPGVRAWAESPGDPFAPPSHRIVMTYELARQLYRDAEEYHDFASSDFLDARFQSAFKDYDPKPKLSSHIERPHSIANMFIGSLTWVFFHELGHLMQEHGYIRNKFADTESDLRIEDCEADAGKPLEGKAAAISHVTEIAADVEATQWCVSELVRHFLPQRESNDEHSLLEFRSNLALLVNGISCAFYRFYGVRPTNPEPVPTGTHPTPIRRLEVCLPNIFEKLDLGTEGQRLHGLTRPQLVYLCTGAAYSVAFFWARRTELILGRPENFVPKGVLQDPFKKSYWKAIVDAWDEIEPTILKVRRFGSELGLLAFTDTLRAQVS